VSFLVAILIVALLGVVILVVSAPLRAVGRSRDPGPADMASAPGEHVGAPLPEQHELEAARASKYGEIRDAELDFRTGKLSREDYDVIDGELRAEAIEILNRLEALDGGGLRELDGGTIEGGETTPTDDPRKLGSTNATESD
jgi:hypothetical protein